MRKLTKSYGQNVGITELDLTVEHGEVLGFLGANGAGKTTTLRCLVGLLRPTSGAISILGFDPSTDHRELMPRVGYLPGELRLYGDLTGTQHLDLLHRLQGTATSKRGDLCERLGLTERDLGRPIRDYSRGMKQKVGLVQAFQHSPEVVFLDEPTEGLDPLVQQSFFELLDDESHKGNTVFLSSHVMSEVERACHRAAVIKAGALVTVDTVDALRGQRSRRVRVTFASDVDAGAVHTEPNWNSRWEANTLSMTLPPDAVVYALRTLLDDNVTDVVVEEAGLDEAMIDLYRANTL